MKRYLWSFLVVLLAPFTAQAQQPVLKFEHITREDGLANTVVNQIIQDSDGFIWIATEGGLHRSDGYSLKIYRNQPGDSTTLAGNSVSRIFEDHTGTLWVATSSGLSRLDKSRDVFKHYHSGIFAGSTITAIAEDEEGFLWIALDSRGLTRFDPRTDAVEVPKDPLLNRGAIRVLHKDPKNNLWIGTSEGLLCFNLKKNKVFERNSTASGSLLPDKIITSIAGDGRGNLWIGTENGLSYAQVGADSIASMINYGRSDDFGLSANKVNDVIQDKSGKVWIATSNGLDVLHQKPIRMEHCHHSDANPNSISGDIVHAVFEDRQGIIWIGTDAGVSKYDGGKYPFTLMNPSTGFPASNATAIESDRYDVLWVGTPEGLVRYDKKTEDVTVTAVHDNRITRITEDKSGWLWIGTERGLTHYNKSGLFERLNDVIGDEMILGLGVDSENNAWIGTSKGLYKFDAKTHAVSPMFTSLIREPVQAIYCDRTDEVWIGTDRKLVRLLKDGQAGQRTPKTYTHDVDNASSISYNNITAIFQAKDGNIWIGTQGGGLNHFNKAAERFMRYTWDDGLPSDNIRGIEGDGKGNIWITTDKGLCRFDPLRKLFANFDRSDGLQSNVFNIGAIARNNRGELFFGGIRGLNSVYADSIQTTLAAPKILINDFQIRQKSIKPGSKILPRVISETEEIELSYKDNVITFGFVGINHRDPARNKYAYKLENFEEDWNYVGPERRYATYTNLAPGKYNFVIKCMNTDGVWSKETTLKLVIRSPFWKTWWFYLICIALLAAAAYAYHIRKANDLEFVKGVMEQQIARRTAELKREKELGDSASREIEALKKQIDQLKKGR